MSASHSDLPAHGTRRAYLTGFLLAAVLTALPFWLVMGDVLHDMAMTAVAIFGLALVQIAVHVIAFLHLDTRSEGGWSLMAFVFTAVIVVLTIGGSIWVMYHLNTNMMPMMVNQAPMKM